MSLRPLAAAFAALALAACQNPAESPADNPTDPSAAPAPAPAPSPPSAPSPTPAPVPAPTPAAPAPTPAGDQPCRDQIGEAAATALAVRCRAVSPATHPPCNAANPCEMIQKEIDRSCALWADDDNPPTECAG